MNLADQARIRAGEPGRKGGKGIGSERLECATSHRGRSCKGSPPEGPGEAAGEEKISVSRLYTGPGAEELAPIDSSTYLLNILNVV
jgi:hypothetical protein